MGWPKSVSEKEEPAMRTISKILLGSMLLAMVWTILDLTASHARAEPPDPCRFFAKCQ